MIGVGTLTNELTQGTLARALGVTPRFDASRNTIHLVSLSCSAVPPVRYGGIELVVAQLAEGFVARGVKSRVYSPGPLGLEGVLHVRTLPEPSRPVKEGGVPNTAQHVDAVRSGLAQHVEPGDVIILNHPDHYRSLKRDIAWRWRANVYEIAHWTSVALPNRIIYPSASLKQSIGRPGTVIPHGLALRFAQQRAEREPFLFFAGRLTRDKGLDIAADAAATLQIPLVLAGPRNDPAYAEALLSRPFVQYVGELTYEELLGYYARAHALVYMTQYVEPFGLAVIEAMAMGCPVITTGLGGTGETVVPGHTGYFCNTAEDVVAAYSRVHTLDESAVIERARAYTLDAMIDGYLTYLGSGD